MEFGHTCHYCNAPAVKLCDHILGFASDTDKVSLTSRTVTCSRPLCDECTTQQGIIFFTDGADTIDLCPDHIGLPSELRPAPYKTLIAEKRRLQFKQVQ